MCKYLFIVLFFILSTSATAQTPDSLFAVHKGVNLYVKYKIRFGETLPMVALRFYLNNGTLEAANDPDVIKKFASGSIINIPVIRENFYINKQNFGDLHELYYRVEAKDDIGLLCTYSGVTKSQMRVWNGLKGNTITENEVLFMGWVKMITLDTANPATQQAYPIYKKRAVADTGKAPRISGGLDTVYIRQTNNGANALTEKGTAVFFEKPGKNSIYYAFHNTTPRGGVIKVFNPSNGKTIYVKVLGPLPDTKLYANSIIGISSAAKEALGVTDNKAWCELSYSQN